MQLRFSAGNTCKNFGTGLAIRKKCTRTVKLTERPQGISRTKPFNAFSSLQERQEE